MCDCKELRNKVFLRGCFCGEVKGKMVCKKKSSGKRGGCVDGNKGYEVDLCEN